MKRRNFINKSTILSIGSILNPYASFSNDVLKFKSKSSLNNAAEGELLFNGIQLPKIWPPNHLSPESVMPMPVPYLLNPPEVIPIDIGRQLFVDDFLIEETNLKRIYHQAKKISGNPVFKPLTPEETGGLKGKRSVVYFPHGGFFYDWKKKFIKCFIRLDGLEAFLWLSVKI